MGAGHQRAVVVGAGFAGLAAADELRAAGTEVTLLEARERVGGRVFSRRLDNGAVIEMGAEFILPGNTRVHEIAERFGLAIVDKGMLYGRREPLGGAPVDPGAFEDAVARLGEALSDGKAGTESAASLLARLEIDPASREAILARVEISSASAAETVPASDLAGVAYIGDEPASGIAGGNQLLAESIAAELGASVVLGEPVRRVAWGPEGVRIGTEAGTGLDADVCVIAVPAGVNGGIEFEPALPDRLRESLEGVIYGQAAKLLVPLHTAAPPGAVLSVPERYWAWTANGEDRRPMPLISTFAGSEPALDRLGIELGPERWLDSLARLRPDLDLDRAGAVLSRWDDDPWAGAAYSVAPPEAIVAELRRAPAPLAFAGEHLGGRHHGLMEGALRSGREAAERLRP